MDALCYCTKIDIIRGSADDDTVIPNCIIIISVHPPHCATKLSAFRFQLIDALLQIINKGGRYNTAEQRNFMSQKYFKNRFIIIIIIMILLLLQSFATFVYREHDVQFEAQNLLLA